MPRRHRRRWWYAAPPESGARHLRTLQLGLVPRFNIDAKGGRKPVRARRPPPAALQMAIRPTKGPSKRLRHVV